MASIGPGSGPFLIPDLNPKLFEDNVQRIQSAKQNGIGAFNTPSVQGLTSRDISTLFNADRGSYQYFASLSVDQQATAAELAKKNKMQDPGDLAWAEWKDYLRQSDYYQNFKAAVKAELPNASSKDLFQLALTNNPNIPQYAKDAFYLYAQRKKSLSNQQRNSFNNVMKTLREPDEGAQELSRQVEEQANNLARLEAGLDTGGDSGES